LNPNLPNTINWGIIGCGDVCEVKSGPAFNKVTNSRLVAVMRRDIAKAEDYARRHQVPTFYSDAADLINNKQVNAIYIATPPAFHELYTEQALRAGKPVYVEKPVALDAASCTRMIGMEKTFSGKVSVAHYRRALPLFRKVKALVTEGAIGPVRMVQLRTLQPAVNKLITQTDDNWRVDPAISGGGLFFDLSPHQLDIMYWIFGKPAAVEAHSLNQSKQYNAPDITTLQAILKNTDGNEVSLNGVWAFNVAAAATDESCEIIGEKGKLRFSFFRKSTLEVITDAGTQVLEMDYPENIQHPMIDAVTQFFMGKAPNPCTLEDAWITLSMMDKTKT
jgi:1,5-anhydro-D-fructose reductase (1,5-anhydro-D-mannitol-forming)